MIHALSAGSHPPAPKRYRKIIDTGTSNRRKSRYFAGIFQYREQMISAQRSSPSTPLSRVILCPVSIQGGFVMRHFFAHQLHRVIMFHILFQQEVKRLADARCFYPFHFDALLKNCGTSAQLDLRRDATRYKDSIPDFSLCFKGHFPQKTGKILWEKLPLQLRAGL